MPLIRSGSPVGDRLDPGRLYAAMVRMRALEEALAGLWRRGLISGELHLGIGEEAVVAGVADHLRPDDAVSLDYRPTPALVARGVDVGSIVLEVLGHEDGLGRGHGGHMHLFSAAHLATSTGIVGSPAPLACGLALAAARLRPSSIAVAFFGDGAVNQGMVMEAWNLAAVWSLPVLFVVKDNGWAATTRSGRMRAGTIAGRARALGMATAVVDGTRPVAVWRRARALVGAARRGRPGVLVARCRRPTGHMLDDTMSRTVRSPAEMIRLTVELVRPEEGGSRPGGLMGLMGLATTVTRAFMDRALPHTDPLARAARAVGDGAAAVEKAARTDVEDRVQTALRTAGVAP